jgi:hypothetical protein
MDRPKYTATAIGSLPHTDPESAINVIFKSIPEAPIWPQLPNRGLLERMEPQYIEGMPSAVIDREKDRIYFDTARDYSEEFAEFYELYMKVEEDPSTDLSGMAIGPEHSKGIKALLERLKKDGRKLPFVKGQTTGPCSFTLTAVDENKRAIYYNDEFRDMAVKALALKSRWQIRQFAPYAEKVICFIDEPILSAFGSSTYIGVRREDVVAILSEMAAVVRSEGAMAGVHCCGNTEWSILVDAGFDLINLDAYTYGHTLGLYPDKIKSFIKKDGIIAWGIVPTSQVIKNETVELLCERLFEAIDALSAKCGIEKDEILSRSMITPSCGTGSLSIEDAERVFDTLSDLAKYLNETA